ncbi:MAG TPA: hypothetical protein VLA45_18220, partial [Paracoccaceae bacterium]|nr:hypothetical protein [Paracoccaceae bacterium]
PDNLNVGSDGLIWVAMVMSLTRDLAKLWAAPYWLRWLLARAPAFIKGRPDRVVLVAAYDFDGVLHRSLRLEDGPFHFVTSAREVAGLLYLTSIEEGAVARIRLPT